MQKESLEERLRKHPTLRARVESLIDMVEDESGQLERADDAEEFLISVGLVHALCSGLPLTKASSAALSGARCIVRLLCRLLSLRCAWFLVKGQMFC